MAVKAARFRTALVQLRASGVLRTASDSPAVRLGRKTGIEAAVGRTRNRKDINMTTQNKTRPTHRLYAVTKSGDTKFWRPVGALWSHADNKGFNLRLEYLPLNEGELVIRIAGDEQAEGNGGAL